MAKQSKEDKQQEKINKLKEKKAFKYTNIKEHQLDLNDRLKIALQTGRDPLELLSITQIVEDIETVNRLLDVDINE